MNIGVDIRVFSFKHGKTGIARYLKSILNILQQEDSYNRYFLFECKKSSNYPIKNPLWKKIGGKFKIPGTIWQQLFLPILLKKHAIDCLWCPEQISPILTPRNTKIVTTIHDNVHLRYPETMRKSVFLIMKYLYPLTLIKSDTLLAISKYVRDETINYYRSLLKNKQIHVIYNGKPDWSIPDNYHPDKRSDFLFYAGNLEPRKNLVTLIKALEILKKKERCNIPLHLVGPKGWKNESLFMHIKNSEVKDNIVVKGYLSEQELKWEYLHCKAMVYPSVYEGFGLPVLEALLLDCIVITSKQTVMEEIAGQCGVYFNPHSVYNIAETIKYIYSEEFDRNAFLSRKESILKKFSWYNTAMQVKKHFYA